MQLRRLSHLLPDEDSLPNAQAAFADWDTILATPAPPSTARGMCGGPGAYQYAKAASALCWPESFNHLAWSL